MMLDRNYPKPWPGYTVPEFGGRLNGVEEDNAILQSVIADARATQSIHGEIISHIADWETREPGRLNTDAGLRIAFIDNLDGLRSAFTDRTLGMVGVQFPILLDRTNPAHAIILAVRDDITDTSNRLQQSQAQYLVGKQVSAIRDGQIVKLVEGAIQTAADLLRAGGQGLKDAVPKITDGVTDILKYAALGIGGLALIYGLNLFGGRAKSNPSRRRRRRHRRVA